MKNKSEKWRQTGRWFWGNGWSRARPNSAGNECRNIFPLCFILKQLPLPVLPDWFHEFIFRFRLRERIGSGAGWILPEIQAGRNFILFMGWTKRLRQFEKMTAMKNDSKKNRYGRRGSFILCVFRTGSPENSAKVGAVGDIHFVQWLRKDSFFSCNNVRWKHE